MQYSEEGCSSPAQSPISFFVGRKVRRRERGKKVVGAGEGVYVVPVMSAPRRTHGRFLFLLASLVALRRDKVEG